MKAMSKGLASLAFVSLGFLLISRSSYEGYPLWIVIGLLFGAGGDLALLGESKRSFLLGLVSFLLGHIAYIVACAQLTPIADWLNVYSTVPAIVAVLALVYLWPHLGSMKVAVIAYIGAIVMMVVGAIAVFLAAPEGFEPSQQLLLLAGAALFFVSDLSVAMSRFVRKRFVYKLWGLPAYYGGQLLIAWTLF